MFHNNRILPYSQNEKTTRPRYRKRKSCKKNDTSKQAKNSKNSKFPKNHKHSKFKCINTVSDFLGPDRLTKHVGFLSKGKISNSISRIEKIMSKEVRARAHQDLQEVLKLSHSGKCKNKKSRNCSYESISSVEAQSLQSIYASPQYVNHGSVFASSSWKDKIQKSVGVPPVNSVLASVHEPQKKSPVKELQLTARKVLLNTIHPFIKQVNNLLFPERSSVNKVRNKLSGIRKKLLLTSVAFEKLSPTVISENIQHCSLINKETNHIQNIRCSLNNNENSHIRNSQCSSSNKKISHTQSSAEDDFHLNPIFTGDVIDQNDFTQIFPSVKEFMNSSDNLITDNSAINLPADFCNSETVYSQTQSSVGGKSSITIVPISSMTSEEDSPVWKLQLSPAKFVPELDSTPTLYFRHKMF